MTYPVTYSFRTPEGEFYSGSFEIEAESTYEAEKKAIDKLEVEHPYDCSFIVEVEDLEQSVKDDEILAGCY